VQKSFSAAELPGVDKAYMKGLHMAFALAIATGGMATVVTVEQSWFRLTKAEESETEGIELESREGKV